MTEPITPVAPTASTALVPEPAKRPHVSPTQIELIAKCPEAYRRRYIEGEIIPPGIAALKGTGVHAGAAHNFTQKIETFTDLPKAEIAEAAVTAYEAATHDSYQLTDEERARGKKIVLAEAKDQIALLAEIHAEQQAPDYQPRFVEQRVTIPLPGASHDLLGIIDLTDDQDRVTDFKTAGKKKPQEDADGSVQLTVYAAAHKVLTGVLPKEVRLDVLTTTKSPARQVLRSSRDMVDFGSLAARINTMLKLIDAGIFPPTTPGAWWCGAKWCGYYSTCPYVQQGERLYSLPEPAKPDLTMPSTEKEAQEMLRWQEQPEPAPLEAPAKPKRNTKKTKATKAQLLLQHPHCRWCRKTLTARTATIEHVVPRAHGGSDNENNLDLACKECNEARADSGLDPKDMQA